jgi:hypothetical protein
LPFGFTQEYEWNPAGRGLIFERQPFPVIAVGPDAAATLRARARDNAARGPSSYPRALPWSAPVFNGSSPF